MANLFVRRFDWLYHALGLQEAQLPSYLESEVAVPTVDVVQGGWGLARWFGDSLDQPASAAQASRTWFAADADLVRIVWMSFVRTGGAGDTTADIRINNLLGIAPYVARATLAPGGYVGHAQIFGNMDPIVVPPGFRLETVYPATGLGETWAGRIMAAELPAGVKPW